MLPSTFLNSSCLLLGIQLIVGAIASPVKELNVSIDDRSLDTDTTVLAERDMTWDELQGLVTHNGVRKSYKCPPLVWDDSLAEGARQWAQSIATGPFAGKLYEVHAPPNTWPGLGENLNVQIIDPNGNGMDKVLQTAARKWGDGRMNYKNYGGKNKYDLRYTFDGADKFTQLVWRASTKVGMGSATYKRPDNSTIVYTVARYYTQGNIEGQVIF